MIVNLFFGKSKASAMYDKMQDPEMVDEGRNKFKPKMWKEWII